LALGPAVVCIEGDQALLNAAAPRVAVVGTRRCSGRGAAFARHLAHSLAQAGVVVVSGLASGIDAAAHRGALQAGQGRTIAVLGHGLGTTYPSSNRGLRRAIARQGGVVLSGWPDDTRPAKWTFPQRNRWVAALSDAVVVVEAPVGSGALITAKDAQLLGRPVWVVPGTPQAHQSSGNLAFLRKAMQDQEAHTRQLGLFLDEAERNKQVPARARAVVAPSPVHLLDSVQDFVQEVSGRSAPPVGSEWLRQILLGQTVDQVSRHTGLPVLDLVQRLSELELLGQLVPLPGGRYGPGRSV
jgi:DNA processing protein